MEFVVWAIFALLAISQVYIIYKFAHNREGVFVRSVLLSFLSFTVYIILITIFGLKIPGLVLIFAMISLFIHTFFGYFLKLYERTRKFDMVIHSVGSFAYALLTYCTLIAIFGAVHSKVLGAIFIGALGITLGVFIEIMEFASDSNRKTKLRMQKGLHDTDFDLIADVIGAVGAVIYALFLIL